jgi:DtxR family Mn-dependent transcriptional regulator
MTQSLEDYLEMVSFLSDEGEVRVTDIASRLGVSKPSVLSALKTLEQQGLLEHQRYRTVSLTQKGILLASGIRDRHNFLTTFLRDTVGVSAEIAEEDACKMEHILSDETLRKMKSLAKATYNGVPRTKKKS